MRVEVWSDVVCPWCYIGKRRLETALERFDHRDEVEVVWRSFQLDPTVPEGETHATLQACRAADMFLKIDRLTRGQSSSSSVSLSDVQVSDSLSVQSTGSLDTTVDSSRASNFYIKISALTGDSSRSHVTLTSTDCDDQLSVQSNAPVDFSGEQLRSVDFFLKFSSYFPYTGRLCVNGHEYAKRQAAKAGIAFTALDDGFAALQARPTCRRCRRSATG